jgi:hypothetical protein
LLRTSRLPLSKSRSPTSAIDPGLDFDAAGQFHVYAHVPYSSYVHTYRWFDWLESHCCAFLAHLKSLTVIGERSNTHTKEIHRKFHAEHWAEGTHCCADNASICVDSVADQSLDRLTLGRMLLLLCRGAYLSHWAVFYYIILFHALTHASPAVIIRRPVDLPISSICALLCWMEYGRDYGNGSSQGLMPHYPANFTVEMVLMLVSFIPHAYIYSPSCFSAIRAEKPRNECSTSAINFGICRHIKTTNKISVLLRFERRPRKTPCQSVDASYYCPAAPYRPFPHSFQMLVSSAVHNLISIWLLSYHIISISY